MIAWATTLDKSIIYISKVKKHTAKFQLIIMKKNYF